MRVRDCLRCGRPTLSAKAFTARSPADRAGFRRYSGRGLCTTCYSIEKYHQRLETWPRTNWHLDELLDEWARLRGDGVTDLVEAAGRIGISPEALDRALHRAMKHGDARGRHAGCRKLNHLRPGSRLTTTSAGV